MREAKFKKWLRENGYKNNTVNSRISSCRRIEKEEGDLDDYYNIDLLDNLISKYSYDRNSSNINHNVDIKGNAINGTASLKSALILYKKYRDEKRGLSDKRISKTSKDKKNTQIDSYQKFIDRFNISKTDLYNFGLNETITPNYNKAKKYWDDLKYRVFNNKIVYIRGAGRDAKGTQIYLDFYKVLFDNDNITKDSTNNLIPQKIMEEITGLKRNKDIINYQVSHTFGQTRNPLLFEAPWNIAYVPKVFDPFTGHETNGHWPVEYQKLYIGMIRQQYKEFIDEYNLIIEKLDVEKTLKEFLSNANLEEYGQKRIKIFQNRILVDLSKI